MLGYRTTLVCVLFTGCIPDVHLQSDASAGTGGSVGVAAGTGGADASSAGGNLVAGAAGTRASGGHSGLGGDAGSSAASSGDTPEQGGDAGAAGEAGNGAGNSGAGGLGGTAGAGGTTAAAGAAGCPVGSVVSGGTSAGGSGGSDVSTCSSGWSARAPLGGVARRYATGFSTAFKGYVALGRGVASGADFLSDFWEWDHSSNTWQQRADFAGGPRIAAVGFAIGDKALAPAIPVSSSPA